jgi:hypothetical protein
MPTRREFLGTSAVVAADVVLARAASAAAERPMIGTRVDAVSFVDEGTERVLEGLREMAAVDSLFVAAFTYGRGIAGRMPRGNPLPDHGGRSTTTTTAAAISRLHTRSCTARRGSWPRRRRTTPATTSPTAPIS